VEDDVLAFRRRFASSLASIGTPQRSVNEPTRSHAPEEGLVRSIALILVLALIDEVELLGALEARKLTVVVAHVLQRQVDEAAVLAVGWICHELSILVVDQLEQIQTGPILVLAAPDVGIRATAHSEQFLADRHFDEVLLGVVSDDEAPLGVDGERVAAVPAVGLCIDVHVVLDSPAILFGGRKPGMDVLSSDVVGFRRI